jgi:threonyl-tRNA synthetase
VLFACVEKIDEINPLLVIASAAKGVMVRLGQIKVRRVMVFPYAHLASALGSPVTALQILKGLEEALKAEGIEVKRAPFGWYKEFELKNKGHPLADLSMTICPFEGCACDFACPYCHSPLRRSDLAAPAQEFP